MQVGVLVAGRVLGACRDLAQRRHGYMIHVLENLVLSDHAPDKGIGLCSHTTVDRPTGVNYCLLIAYHQVARLRWLPHHVENSSVFAHIEIEIDFHAPVVGMAWHGVP